MPWDWVTASPPTGCPELTRLMCHGLQVNWPGIDQCVFKLVTFSTLECFYCSHHPLPLHFLFHQYLLHIPDCEHNESLYTYKMQQRCTFIKIARQKKKFTRFQIIFNNFTSMLGFLGAKTLSTMAFGDPYLACWCQSWQTIADKDPVPSLGWYHSVTDLSWLMGQRSS